MPAAGLLLVYVMTLTMKTRMMKVLRRPVRHRAEEKANH